MMTYDTDILICGAGAAGLTLAIDLARRGVAFRIIERQAQPFHGSRGKGIQPRSQEIFEDLGILDRVVAAGGIYPPVRSYGDNATFKDVAVAEVQDASPQEPYRQPLLVPQFLTERVMRQRLLELGYQVEFGVTLKSFEQDGACVKAHVAAADGEHALSVRYLVGADGGGSAVRKALRIDFPGKTLGVRAVVADVRLQGLTRDAWHRFNDGSMEKQIGICPLSGTDLFQLQAPVPLEGDIDLSAQGLTAMIAERTGRADIVVGAVWWASDFNMHARLAERYRDGRVLIAGDAAHVHPPTGGQGLNTSLQDAYNLGWKLAAVLNGASDALLDTYEEERRPVAAEMLGLSSRLLEDSKAGNMKRGREVQQLDLGYPGSSLALEAPLRDRRAPGISAGDRAPDAPALGAAGQALRLFDLFKGPHWTLLGYEVDAIPEFALRAGLRVHLVGPECEVIDSAGHIHAGYGLAKGDWILLRPDGYVGAIVSSANLDSLRVYLGKVGLAEADKRR